MPQGRHAAPISAYNAEEAAARLHAEMLSEALAHIDGLAANWPDVARAPYRVDPSTGTLRALLIAAESPTAEDSRRGAPFAS